jgi:hypothetical protein
MPSRAVGVARDEGMIAGFEHRWQVEAQLGALERELRGHIRDERHRASIEAQMKVFAAELERLDREGDYQEPERVVRQGAFAWIGEHGHPSVR